MNLATEIMKKTTAMLIDVNAKLKEYATEPYGVRKLTPQEQYEQYKNLTPEKLIDTLGSLDSKGFKAFNEWLYKMEQKEQNG